MADFTVVFGDVHGDADKLGRLVKLVWDRYGQKNVAWYSTGDLVDRGPGSKDVVSMCIDLGVKAVIGNHETWLHQYFSTGTFDSFALNDRIMGGSATLKSYGLNPVGPAQVEAELAALVPKSHRDYILGMPVWRKFRVDGTLYRLTHAGLDIASASPVVSELEEGRAKGYPIPPRSSEDYGDAILDTISETSMVAVLLWVGSDLRQQEPPIYSFPDGSIQVFGHTPAGRRPRIEARWVALDTGCGAHWPHVLSAVVLPDRHIIQVDGLTGKLDEGGFSDFALD